mgnify:CR=1 FL=1
MKKIILLLLVVSAVTFTAPANKNRNQNLNTTVQNSKKGETAKEAWERVKPEIKIRLNKISKDLVAGNYKASFDEMPEKFLTYLAKKGSMSVNELKNITIKTMSKLTDNMKIIENTSMPASMRWGVRPEVSNQAGTLVPHGEGARLATIGTPR